MIRVVKLKLLSLKSNLMSFNCVVFLRQNNVTASFVQKLFILYLLYTMILEVLPHYIKTKPINILLGKFLNT